CLALLPRYFFVAPPPTHQYHTLPLHDALPIAVARHPSRGDAALRGAAPATRHLSVVDTGQRRLRARRGRTARTPPGMARADRLAARGPGPARTRHARRAPGRVDPADRASTHRVRGDERHARRGTHPAAAVRPTRPRLHHP